MHFERCDHRRMCTVVDTKFYTALPMWTLVFGLVLLWITLSNAFLPRFRSNYKYTGKLSMNEVGGEGDEEEETEAARQQRRAQELEDSFKSITVAALTLDKARREGDKAIETEAAQQQIQRRAEEIMDDLKSIKVQEYAWMLKILAEEWWRTIPRTSAGKARMMDLKEAADRFDEYSIR